jgi:hypothetical protein
MDHLQSGLTPCGEKNLVGLDCPSQLRHIVPQHFAKATRLKKIALHIDDQQSALGRQEGELIGFGINAECLIGVHGAMGGV